jgi:tRNA threonylcarbamoyladenosine modification (KEOPS) complex  Pcc1 subunit
MKNQKNEILSLNLKIISSNAKPLSASIATEASFKFNNNNIINIHETAESFVDLRARWNTIMRGLIVSKQVLETVKKEG